MLTKLVELDGDSYPYPTALIVATLAWAGKTLVMPEGMKITKKTSDAFNNMLLKDEGYNCKNYRLVSRYILGLVVEIMPEEVRLAHNKHLESKLD